MSQSAGRCSFLGLSIVAGLALAAGPPGEPRLPTAEEVKRLQTAYRAERDLVVKSKAQARFLPDLFERAEANAKRADAAIATGRFLQAAEAYRQARWQLPYEGPKFPPHVARVLGNLRLRHGDKILSMAVSPDGRFLATGSADRTVKIWDMGNGHELLTYRKHSRYIRTVQFSPDGKWIASAGGDSEVRLWDPLTGKDVRTLTLPGVGNYITAMAVSPEGKYVFVASSDRSLQVFEADTGQLKRAIDKMGGPPGVRSLAFSPDKAVFAAGQENGHIRLWAYPEIATTGALDYWQRVDDQGFGSVNFLAFSPDSKMLVVGGLVIMKIYETPRPGGGVQVKDPRRSISTFDLQEKDKTPNLSSNITFSRDGKTLFAGSADGVVQLFDSDTGNAVGSYKGHTGEITALVLNPDGTQLLSVSADSTVRQWDFDIVVQARQFVGHSAPVWTVDLSPDGQRIASGSADRTARLWDVAEGNVLRKLGEHSAGVTVVRFSPNGKSVLVGTGQSLRLFEADSGKPRQNFDGHTGIVTTAAFDASGSRVVSGSADKAVIVWSVETGKIVQKWDAGSLVMAVAFTPDGKQVAVGLVDEQVCLFDAETGKSVWTWIAHSGAVTGLSFDAAGSFLATCGFDGLVHILNMAKPNVPPATLTGHQGPLSAVAFRGDGQYLVSAGLDRVVKLWKKQGGIFKESQVFRGHKDWITALTFSRDGHYVLSASADKTLRFWEVASRELPLTAEHTGAVDAVAISPDGKHIASGATDRTVKIWERATGKELFTLRGHRDAIVSLAFSPDGTTLYSSGEDRDVRCWDVALGKEKPPLAEQHQLKGFKTAVPAIAVSGDGKRLLVWEPASDRGSSLLVFNTANGAEIGKCLDNGRNIQAAGFSKDGKTVAFGAADGSVRVWKPEEKTDKPGSEWQAFGKEESVASLAVAPDAGFLVVGGEGGKTHICDPETGKILATLDGHAGRVHASAISADGQRVATAAADSVVKLWDRSGKLLRQWDMPAVTREKARFVWEKTGFVSQLAFTPDGRYLVTANANSTLFVLELP
jgi:WD40 repeat protein